MAAVPNPTGRKTVTLKVDPVPMVFSGTPLGLFGYKPERGCPRPMIAWAPTSRSRQGTRRLGCGKPPARRSTVVRGGDSGDPHQVGEDDPPGHRPPDRRRGHHHLHLDRLHLGGLAWA
jgi:hypothetical protein